LQIHALFLRNRMKTEPSPPTKSVGKINNAPGSPVRGISAPDWVVRRMVAFSVRTEGLVFVMVIVDKDVSGGVLDVNAVIVGFCVEALVLSAVLVVTVVGVVVTQVVDGQVVSGRVTQVVVGQVVLGCVTQVVVGQVVLGRVTQVVVGQVVLERVTQVVVGQVVSGRVTQVVVGQVVNFWAVSRYAAASGLVISTSVNAGAKVLCRAYAAGIVALANSAHAAPINADLFIKRILKSSLIFRANTGIPTKFELNRARLSSL
jgi:hypothetical protein